MSDMSMSDFPLPAIMTDDEIEQAIEDRRYEKHNPFRRKEKPDPWRVVASRYPRIAERIQKLWGTAALDECINRLVIDDRGDRNGFPPDVLAAIMEIGWFHGQRYMFRRNACPWEEDVSQTKWWDRG